MFWHWLTLAVVAAVLVAVFAVSRIVFAFDPEWLRIATFLAFMLAVIGVIEIYVHSRRMRPVGRYLSLAVPVLLLVTAVPGSNLAREQLIAADEASVTGVVAASRFARPRRSHRVYSVRVDYVANGISYQTGWQTYGPESPGQGAVIRVRYRASDPRIALINAPADH